LFSLIR